MRLVAGDEVLRVAGECGADDVAIVGVGGYDEEFGDVSDILAGFDDETEEHVDAVIGQVVFLFDAGIGKHSADFVDDLTGDIEFKRTIVRRHGHFKKSGGSALGL